MEIVLDFLRRENPDFTMRRVEPLDEIDARLELGAADALSALRN